MPCPVDAYEKRAQKQERDNQEDSYFPVGAYRFYKEKGKEKNKHKNAAVKERRYADNNPVIRSDDQLFKKIQKIVIRDVNYSDNSLLRFSPAEASKTWEAEARLPARQLPRRFRQNGAGF